MNACIVGQTGVTMSWFSRKGPKPDASGLESERYRGRPLLILLENYVLYVIGQLPPKKIPTIQAAVQRVWGGDADWCATLRKTLDLEDTIDDSLRSMWARNQGIARERGEVLTPEDFARMVADTNFAPILERTA